jgi:transcriptional regulator with XRE-family HTH domain
MKIVPKSREIQELLAHKGKSQNDVRKGTGLSSVTLTAICGGRRNVTAPVAKRFADALEVPVNEVFQFVHDEDYADENH